MNIEEVRENLKIYIDTTNKMIGNGELFLDTIVNTEKRHIKSTEILLKAYEKEKEERERIGKLYYEANENCIKYEKELEKEKEIIKNAIYFLKYYNKDFNEMSDNEIKQILYFFDKCADIKKEE